MLPQNKKNNETYENQLAELVPFISKLSTKSRVIWLHQNPIIDTYEGEFVGPYPRYITQHLIDHYNEAARRIFR
jgi:hypothetical protein